MSDPTQANSPTLPMVEIISGDESDTLPVNTPNFPASRQNSVIEITSDVSDDDVEIVAENNTHAGGDDIEITGQSYIDSPISEIEYPGGPPSRPISRGSIRRRPISEGPRHSTFARNVRRRPNPRQQFYQAAFIHGAGSPLLSYDDIPAMLAEHQRHILQYFRSRDGEISSAIMERISREEENSLDRKMESENKHNRKVLEKKKDVANGELDGYTNDISPEDNIMCELCGVVLGEGIPSDFEPNPKYDEDLEKHASISQVMAPWYCIRQCFSTDKELSKRVFAAKCGHVFCGRCIRNIGNRPAAKRGENSNEITILNPQISAPRKCPAEGCGITFNKGKKTKTTTFTEVFL